MENFSLSKQWKVWLQLYLKLLFTIIISIYFCKTSSYLSIYLSIYIYIYICKKNIYISFTSNSTTRLKKIKTHSIDEKAHMRHCSLVIRNHFCHQTKDRFKERSLINSLEKIQENLSLFSSERRVSFIDFLKDVLLSRDFCCWSNSLFQSLGCRDETENLFDCILIDFQQNCSY